MLYGGNMKVVDVKQKELRWFNRNYFYITTICLITLFCMCYFFLNSQLAGIIENKYWNLILSTFKHNSLIHLICNMVFFFIISLFLERHYGSLVYLLIFIFAVPFTNMAMFAITQSTNFNGECAINFFMYAVAIVTVIVRLNWYLNWRIFFPLIEVGFALVYMSMSCDTATSVGELLAISFLSNLIFVEAHWSAMVIGALTMMFGYMFVFVRSKSVKKDKSGKNLHGEIKKDKNKKFKVQKILKSEKLTVLKNPKTKLIAK